MHVVVILLVDMVAFAWSGGERSTSVAMDGKYVPVYLLCALSLTFVVDWGSAFIMRRNVVVRLLVSCLLIM